MSIMHIFEFEERPDEGAPGDRKGRPYIFRRCIPEM